MNHWLRNIILLTLMLAASGMAVALRPTQKIADLGPKLDLEKMIPATFGEWQVDNTIIPIQPPPEQQELIDRTYDQTLARTYFNAAGTRIMLSIAYGGHQKREMSTHRPEVCYPAQGFELLSSRQDSLPVQGRTLPLNRVVARQGARNEPISYWVVVGDELTKFGIRHRLAMMKYNLTGRIPDGMLVRVSSIDNDEQHAFKLQNQYINDMLSALSEKDQTRLLGALPN